MSTRTYEITNAQIIYDHLRYKQDGDLADKISGPVDITSLLTEYTQGLYGKKLHPDTRQTPVGRAAYEAGLDVRKENQ